MLCCEREISCTGMHWPKNKENGNGIRFEEYSHYNYRVWPVGFAQNFGWEVGMRDRSNSSSC